MHRVSFRQDVECNESVSNFYAVFLIKDFVDRTFMAIILHWLFQPIVQIVMLTCVYNLCPVQKLIELFSFFYNFFSRYEMKQLIKIAKYSYFSKNQLAVLIG